MYDFKEGRILPADRISALYEFLIEQGDQWTETMDAYNSLREFYGDEEQTEWVDSEMFHNTAERMRMTNDIRYINNSPHFQKIIICGKKGIKIANEEEAERYIKNLYYAVFRRFKRVRTIERKARLDSQITLNNQTIEAFLEETK